MTSDWQTRLKDAVDQQRLNDALGEALLGMFGDNDWRMIRGVSQRWRHLEHDLCFAVAECALKKLRSYVEGTIKTCGRPPVINKPAALLRRYVRWCLDDLRLPTPTLEAEDTASEASDPSLRAALILCVEAMKPELREILRMKVDGLDETRAAVKLKLSPAGVRTRFYKARGELEACLKARGFDVVEGGDDA